MRSYRTWEDVEAHMKEMINSRRPYKGTAPDGRSFILLPLDTNDCGQLISAMIQYPDAPGNGQIATCECNDFEEILWEDVDLPRDQWEQYLPTET